MTWMVLPRVRFVAHVRRFMCFEGPLFAEVDDKPNPDLGYRSRWWHILDGAKLIGGGVIGMVKLEWQDRNPMGLVIPLLLCVVLLPVLPFLSLFGFFFWLPGAVKLEPRSGQVACSVA